MKGGLGGISCGGWLVKYHLLAPKDLLQSTSEVFTMILQDIIADIHALNEDLEVYERNMGFFLKPFTNYT